MCISKLYENVILMLNINTKAKVLCCHNTEQTLIHTKHSIEPHLKTDKARTLHLCRQER